MKVNVIKVNYEVFSQQHFFYTGIDPQVCDTGVVFPFSEALNSPEVPSPEVFLPELQKITKTVHITSVSTAVVSLSEYHQHSFETVKDWYLNNVETPFNHLDKEAIES